MDKVMHELAIIKEEQRQFFETVMAIVFANSGAGVREAADAAADAVAKVTAYVEKSL